MVACARMVLARTPKCRTNARAKLAPFSYPLRNAIALIVNSVVSSSSLAASIRRATLVGIECGGHAAIQRIGGDEVDSPDDAQGQQRYYTACH